MTDVIRGAGRRRYEANKKHQQRTPLPPKDPNHQYCPSTKRGQCLTCGKPKADAIHEPTPRQKAREIVKEEAEAVVKEVRRRRPVAASPAEPIEEAKPTHVSKAQQLSLAAEAAGWEVERFIDGNKKTLVATRGDERLTANWVNDKSCKPLGTHELNGASIRFDHVTVAIRILGVEPDVAIANARTAVVRKSAPKVATHRSVASGVPFNVATVTDEEVLKAVLGHRVEWRCRLTDEFTNSAVVPLNGLQTKLVDDDLEDRSTRQLTFCDADGGGFRTLRLSALIDVSIEQVDDGHMLTLAKASAMEAIKEGRRKAS